MDFHIHAKYLFIETVLKPRLIETEVELVTTTEADIITSNKCLRGGRVAEMGFHASPGVTGNFYIKAKTGQDPQNWPSTPQPNESQVNCRDIKNPRVIVDGIGPGFFKKITVFVHDGQGNWDQLYDVYFDVVKMVSVITVHEMPKAPAVGPQAETLPRDAEDTQFWFFRLCSHGLPYESTGVRRGSADDSKLLPDLFNGRHFSGNKPGSAIISLGSEALSSLSEDSWKFHLEAHQMVPDSDFNEENKQRATRLFINSAQHLATLYYNIYRVLEVFIREMASRGPLKIFTLSLNHQAPDASNFGNLVPSELIKVVMDKSTGCKYTFIVDNNLTKAGKYAYSVDYCPKRLTDLLGLTYEDDKMKRLHCYRIVTRNILNAVRPIHKQVYDELNEPNKQDCTFF